MFMVKSFATGITTLLNSFHPQDVIYGGLKKEALDYPLFLWGGGRELVRFIQQVADSGTQLNKSGHI